MEIRNDGILSSAVEESTKMRKAYVIAEQCSVQEAYKFLEEADGFADMTSVFKMPKEKPKKSDNVSTDGLITSEDYVSPDDMKVPGCLVKDLDRGKVILLYLDDICLGYYYIELED